MRILANYGLKISNESYSVTFESLGDVPREEAPNVADDLFKLCKETIERQIAGKKNDPLGIDPSKYSNANNNHSYQGNNKGNGKPGNGNGNGGNGNNKNYGKVENGKNGDAKITANQKKFLYRLLSTVKNLSGDEATDYLKNELNVQYVNDILASDADLFIQKLLQESGQNRGDGNGKRYTNGSYQRQPN